MKADIDTREEKRKYTHEKTPIPRQAKGVASNIGESEWVEQVVDRLFIQRGRSLLAGSR